MVYDGTGTPTQFLQTFFLVYTKHCLLLNSKAPNKPNIDKCE